MSYSLYLDDERTPKTERDWVIVRCYDDFVSTVQERGLPSYVSLDHDLGEEKSGYDCVKWFIDHCIDNEVKPSEVEIHAHTANPVGRDNIVAYVTSWIKHYGICL